MTEPVGHTAQARCRLIILDTDARHVLTDSESKRPRLPLVHVPDDVRVAEFLTDWVEQRYGLPCILLAVLPTREVHGGYAVLEIGPGLRRNGGPLHFLPWNSMDDGDLGGSERAAVDSVLNGSSGFGGRFARPGWIRSMFADAGIEVDPHHFPLVRHINHGIDFCLLRVEEVSGRRWWFKAVGAPNEREYALTEYLARRFPSRLPRVFRSLPNWHGWVMEHVEGPTLAAAGRVELVEQSLAALASMQRGGLDCVPELLRTGAQDWRLTRLRTLLDPFFRDMETAMRAQESTRSTPLSTHEIAQLQADVRTAVETCINSGMPETLLHGDIGHGNVLIGPDGPVFLDWAEGAVGLPQISAEHLLADLVRSRPEWNNHLESLRNGFFRLWSQELPPSARDAVFGLSPAIAALVYALSVWEKTHNQQNRSASWPVLRSLLRRIRHELGHRTAAIA